MNWRLTLGQALAVIATSVLVVEFVEFLILGYIWIITTEAKEISLFEYLFIFFSIVAMIFATLLACISALFTLCKKKILPTLRVFIYFNVLAALTQTFFLVVGASRFQGEWINDFFNAKQATFAVGLIAGISLIIAGLLVRAGQILPSEKKNNPNQ